jgi:hypothetical protein
MSTGTATPPPPTPPKNRGLDEPTWKRLLTRISEQKCTPVIGSGACTAPPIDANSDEWGKLGYPRREQIALEFATEYEYPHEDRTDLERVAKYVAAMSDVMVTKEGYARHFKDLPVPKFSEIPSEPHRVLASLPFSVYLTSNFDDWMFRALEHAKRDAHQALCRWNKHIPKDAPSFNEDNEEFQYSVANPLVYYFHGCTPWAESAVVTEDDYFDFLINISREKKLLTHYVDRAMGGALLFLGYTLSDWDFLVLFRLFAEQLRNSGSTHIAVQLEPSNAPGGPLQNAQNEQNEQNAINYLNSYFGYAKIKVYWGSCQQFCHDLRTRWEGFKRP